MAHHRRRDAAAAKARADHQSDHRRSRVRAGVSAARSWRWRLRSSRWLPGASRRVRHRRSATASRASRSTATIATDPAGSRRSRRSATNAAVKAVIVAINSPGGTTAGGEELYEALGAARQEAGGRGDQGARRLGRLHDRDRDRPHLLAPALDRRLDRRAVPDRQCRQADADDRRRSRQGRDRSAQGRARPRRADVAGGARVDAGAGQRQL